MVIGVFGLGLRVWGSYGYRGFRVWGLGFREVMAIGV